MNRVTFRWRAAALPLSTAVITVVVSAGLTAGRHQTPPIAGLRGAAPARQVMGAGPGDRPAVDVAAADRGKAVWTTDCASCHGADARGTEKGPNLIRSV